MSAYGNDCHFYYNTTCTKGENCAFRHCEAAKTCTVTCSFWQQGICFKANCPYRHVELPPEPVQRIRQAIPCYWENQPIGCSRVNCQFQHFKSRPAIQGGTPIQNQPPVSDGQLPDMTIPPPLFGQGPPVSQTVVPIPGAPIIQPVVVQFSDSEVESEKNSPVKNKSANTTVTSSTKTKNTVSRNTSTPSQIPSTSSQTASATSQNTDTSVIPVLTQTQARTSSVTTLDLDYFIGKPFNKTTKSPPRSPVRYYSPDRRSYGSRDSRYSNSRSPSPRERSISPRYRRSTSPRRSRSPRRRSPYFRDRSASRSPRRWSPRRRSPSPRRRSPPRNQITRPQDRYLTSRRPVHERLNRDRDYSSASSSRERQPVSVQSKKISLSKIKDKTDSDDDKIKVKSLEEIQRAKALLSMGLIELQSGKIVKIGEVNKFKEEDTVKKLEDEPKRKKKIVKKPSVKVKKVVEKPKPKLKPKPKVKKVVKKVEKKEEVESEEENVNEDVVEKEEDNLEDGDDLGEEPEIDIGEVTGEFEEPESEEKEESAEEEEGEEGEDGEGEVEGEEEEEQETEEQSSESEPEIQYTEDIRRAVRKEDVNSKIGSDLKRKRQVIVDDVGKKTTAEIKVSVQSRLGRKLKSTEVKAVPKTNSSVKSRLSLKNDKSSEKNSSSNTGTSKMSGGIKSRLGLGAITSSVKSDSVNSEPKKIVLKRTLETDKKDDKKLEVKKRRWNKSSVKSRLGDSDSSTNISSSDLKKIIIVRNIDDDNSKSGLESEKELKKEKTTSKQNQSQVKSTLSRINKIIEEKKEMKKQEGSDSEAQIKVRKTLNVWSTRVAGTIASTKPTKKESDIDLYDSSSNDSLLDEPVLPTKRPKPIRKDPKQERALYVPPGRKRTVTSYDDQDVHLSPLKKSQTKEKVVKEVKEPETIKTYSQIMEEKRKKLEKQREKKAKAEEKSKKKKISRIEVSDKENESRPKETKVVVESKPVSTVKTEVPVTKSSLLDSFSFSLPETKENQPHSNNQPQSDKDDSTAEHIELLSTLATDGSNNKLDESQDKSPTKTTSDDNWLDFSKDDLDMTGCDTADDDDLLREIDELLA